MGNTALTTATQAAPEVEWMWQASLLSLEGSYVVIKKLFEVVDIHSNQCNDWCCWFHQHSPNLFFLEV